MYIAVKGCGDAISTKSVHHIVSLILCFLAIRSNSQESADISESSVSFEDTDIVRMPTYQKANDQSIFLNSGTSGE